MTEEALSTQGEEAETLPDSDVSEAPAEALDEQAEEAAPSEETGEKSEQPKKSKGGFQRRIDQITREKYELQQKLEQQQAEAEQLRQTALQQQLQQAGDIQMPKLADYGYNEEVYAQAVQQWHKATIDAQTEQQEQFASQKQQVQQQQQKHAVLMAKVSEANQKYPDFSAKVNDPQLPNLQRLSPAAFETILESNKFADVSYYLASNPSELYEFQSLSPIQAVRRVADIESRLGASSTANTAPPPPPPSTVGGKGESVKDPDKMTTSEWMEWRNKQIRKR